MNMITVIYLMFHLMNLGITDGKDIHVEDSINGMDMRLVSQLKTYFLNEIDALKELHRHEIMDLKEFFNSKINRIEERHISQMKALEDKLMSKIPNTGITEKPPNEISVEELPNKGKKSDPDLHNDKMIPEEHMHQEDLTNLSRTKSWSHDRTNPLETTVNEKEKKMMTDKTTFSQLLEDKTRGLQAQTKVAFFASLTPTIQHVGANQNIVFDRAVTNIGQAYNPHHGIFVAPVDGVYVFHITLTRRGQKGTYGHILRNQQILAKLALDVYDYEQSSQTIVVELQKGEDVSVQNSELDAGFDGDSYCTFSGFLLYEQLITTALPPAVEK